MRRIGGFKLCLNQKSLSQKHLPPPPPLKLSLLNFLFLKKNLNLLLFTVLFLFFFTGCNPASIINDEAQQVASLIQNSNPEATYNVRVDRTTPDTPVIIIYGISNTVLGSPLSLTILINQDEEVITTNLNQFIVTASEIISPYVVTERVSATFGSEDPIDIDVIIRIDGATVTDWFTHDTLSRYIDARFAEQAASLRLNDENMLLLENLKNTDSGLGTIELHSLPDGFEADAVMFSFEDPDGADIVTASTTPVPSQFTIKETDRPANDQTYTFAEITLAELDRFIPNVHIRITDDMDAKVSGISIAENDTKQITITGLVNTIGTDKEYTLTISPVQGIFTTPSDRNISITIREPNSVNDFSPGFGTFSPNHTFTVTNEGDASATEYTLVVPFGGAAIADWLTQTEFSSYFTAVTFAGQTGSLSFSFDESSIAIEGNIYNVPNGDIVLTTNLPPGYSVTGDNALKDPDGSAVAEITDRVGFVTITEDENPNNSEEYSVTISLDAYVSPIQLSHVLATDFDSAPIDSSNIQINTNVITISGIPNLVGTNGSGSVTITPPPGYSINPATSLNFDNPQGSDVQSETLDQTVDITDTTSGLTVAHTVKLRFDAVLALTINSPHIMSSPVTLGTGGGTVTIIDLENCEVLPPPNITITGGPTESRAIGFPTYFNRESGSPSVDRMLSILDDGDNEIASVSITVTGFPTCDASHASVLNGSGDDAANAYEIDTAPKLELLSHLVRSDNDNYASKFYKLTADIDLGLAGLPWSEAASGTTGEGFPPIGITDTITFQGTFDCAGKTIFNLYINKANDDYIGLFGYGSGASIQNCSLINVNVKGNNDVGGLAGYLQSSSSITKSYVTGSVSGNDNVGGLVGQLTSSNSSITNSYATGSVSGNEYVGGLAGRLSTSRIENSYATGSVSGTGNNVGGIAGWVSSSNITNSYAIGLVSGTGINVGGLTGSLLRSGISYSYWDRVTSGQDDSAGAALRKSTTQLQSGIAGVGLFTPWSPTIWKFDPDTQYPRLILVACPNRQYPADPNNVPTACTAL